MELQQILYFSVLPAIFILFIFTLKKKWEEPKSITVSNPPPGPWKLPLIGNINQLFHGSLPHRHLRDLAKIYGPIMQLQLGQVTIVVVTSSELAKQVLKKQENNFLDRPRRRMASILFYNRQDVAFAPYGDYWRLMRNIAISGLFSSRRVQYFRSIREDEVSKFIKSIFSKAGTEINLSKMVFSLTNGIIARTTMGSECRKQDFEYIVDAYTKAVGGFSVVDLVPDFKLLHMMSGTRSRLERVHREADKILERIIIEHKSCKKASHHDEKEKGSLLDVLLDLQDHGNLEFPLTMDNIKAIILDMITAGSDTSSALVEWAISELLRSPETLKRAQEEVRQVFNQNGNNHVHVDEKILQELKFLKAIIRETLRLHPPTPIIPRECIETCEINGYKVHANTEVLINTWAIGRDPSYWTNPEFFYPDRFVDTSIDYREVSFELLPFGAGKRMCPGVLLGMANAELPLAQLLYHFDWKLAGGLRPQDIDMTEAFGSITRRKGDLNVIPVPHYSLPVGS